MARAALIHFHATHIVSPTDSEEPMLDLIFLATTVVAFVTCAAYLIACERL